MKITYTKHAQQKFKDLAELGIEVNKRLVKAVVRQPETLDTISDRPNKIASGPLDSRHVLRVVYKQTSAIMTVITFYPARKERYQ